MLRHPISGNLRDFNTEWTASSSTSLTENAVFDLFNRMRATGLSYTEKNLFGMTLKLRSPTQVLLAELGDGLTAVSAQPID
jgi:hypothetical protein